MYYLVTHNDLDGIAAEVVAKYVFKDNVTVIRTEAFDVDNAVNEVLKAINYLDTLFIVDCAPSVEMVESLNQKQFKKVLLDHHSAKFNILDYDWAIVKERGKESGISLFYNYLKSMKNVYIPTSRPLKDFVEMVRKYDTWEWAESPVDKSPYSLNQYFLIAGADDFVNHCLDNFNVGLPALDTFAKVLVNYKEKEIDRYVKDKLDKVYLTEVAGLRAGVILAECHKSILGNAICKTFPVDMAVIIGPDEVSFKSIGNIDVSKVAKLFDGEGRCNTAGYCISKHLKQVYVNSLLGKNGGDFNDLLHN